MNGFIITVLEQAMDFVDSYVYHFDGKPLILDTKEQIIELLPIIIQTVLSDYKDISDIWYSCQTSEIGINSVCNDLHITLSVVSMNGESFDWYAEVCELYGKEDV